MNFHILTRFPDMVEQGLSASILGRAEQAGLISVHAVNIRDYTEDRHLHVDDYPYGGGAGMVMQPGPVVKAVRSVQEKLDRPARVIYLSPQGKTFSQPMARELAREEDLILLCGHYEGLDERAIELVVTEQVSIGDYVLTGGELAAMVMVDAIARMVPGVLTNSESAEEESFMQGLLEYPQYTRPEVFEGKAVPEVLLSGHHANIAAWRRRESLRRTLAARPELLDRAELSKKDRAWLDELRREMSGPDGGDT